jgi:hypothetical protein
MAFKAKHREIIHQMIFATTQNKKVNQKLASFCPKNDPI